ncbi:Thiamine kinase [Streptomyces alboniger]
MAGHHNVNYVVPLGWSLALLLGTMPFRARVKCRMPREFVEVAPRTWPSEPGLLDVVGRHLREVPRCLRDFGDWSLHSYRAGRALSEAEPGEPVGEEVMRELAEFFARTASVPVEELPPRPDGWPESPHSQDFLHRLADWTEEKVHRPNRWRFEELFSAVGVHADVMKVFRDDARTVPDGPGRRPLTPRPFRLLHTDVHRANIVVDRRSVAVIDWELASYGDPLHDLATHLVRMDYDEDERTRMTELWADAMRRAGHGDLTRGMAEDLPVYLDFEYAQSVFPDIMRAALALTALPWQPVAEDYAHAASTVCRALRRAAGPLRLELAPDQERRAEQALRSWCEGPFGRALEKRSGTESEPEPVAEPGTYGGSVTVTDGGAPGLSEARRLLTASVPGCVLLAFDGPLCTLRPDGAAERIADDLRKLAGDRGVLGLLPPEVERASDPHDVLRAVRALRGARQLPAPGLLAEMEALLTAAEATATHTARPTPGAHRFIRELRARHVRMAVVSDTSPRAVSAYLHRYGLTGAFGPHVHGRTEDPGPFERVPAPLGPALAALAADPRATVLIGGGPPTWRRRRGPASSSSGTRPTTTGPVS